MRSVTGRRRIRILVAGVTLVGACALPAAAAAQDVTTTTATATTVPSPTTTTPPVPSAAPKPGHGGVKPAHLSLSVDGIHGDHKLKVGKRARVVGYLRPFVPGQHVRMKLLRHGKVVRKLNPEAKRLGKKNKGVVRFKSLGLTKPGTYRIVATHDRTPQQQAVTARSHKFRIRYPDLDPGNRSSTVKLFNHLLLKQGYFTDAGEHYGVRTQWAVMAFRKVNGMDRTYNANPDIFKKLAKGRGTYNLKYPGKGRHVEVDISRQVMVLADHGKAQHIFAVSTGAPATPTIRGHYQFYTRTAGYNSEGMYYSVYFHNGYATHGYDPDPPYPASHGCVRNPIPDSIFIYNWISLGDSIYLYD
jgi:hypothetical protein